MGIVAIGTLMCIGGLDVLRGAGNSSSIFLVIGLVVGLGCKIFYLISFVKLIQILVFFCIVGGLGFLASKCIPDDFQCCWTSEYESIQ